MRTAIGYRGFWLAWLPLLGLFAAACGTNLSEETICDVQQRYAALCGTAYVEASCRHVATCSFALYKPEYLVAQYQCQSQNLDAKNCASTSCDILTNVRATLLQSAQPGVNAREFAQSCAQKTAECATATAPGAQPAGADPCQPSPLLVDSVYIGLASCAQLPCDQYQACLTTQLTKTLGPGCLSIQ